MTAVLELKGHFPDDEETFAYCDLEDTQSVQQASQRLLDFIDLEGPFPLIGASSAAASLTASMLLQKAREGNKGKPMADGVIFFSPLMPIEYHAFTETELAFKEPGEADLGLIDIPTVTIWGRNDKVHANHAASVTKLCNQELGMEVVHSLGSSIPSAADEDALVSAAQAIRVTADRAIATF